MSTASFTTLFMSDVDETFIYRAEAEYDTDGLSGTVEAIQNIQKRQPLFVWWNTVRVLSTIQKIADTPTLGPILNGFVLDGLVVNNGKQMFVNAEKRPTADWILSLDEIRDEESNWKCFIQEDLGWQHDCVAAIMENAFSEHGFNSIQWIENEEQLNEPYALAENDLRPAYQVWQNANATNEYLYYSPKHNTFRFAVWDDGLHFTHAMQGQVDTIVNSITSSLTQQQIQFEPPRIQQKASHDELHSLNLVRFAPKGVNKASTTQFAASQIATVPPVKAIIVAGDDEPDALMITRDYYSQEGSEASKLPKQVIIANKPRKNALEFPAEYSPLAYLQIGSQKIEHIQATSGRIGRALLEAADALSPWGRGCP